MRPVFFVIFSLLLVVGCKVPQEEKKDVDGLESKTKIADSSSVIDKDADAKQPKENGEAVFYSVEDYPEYPGGDAALLKFLKNHTIFPQSAINDRIEGRVYVKFAIAKDGSVEGVAIARGVRPDLNRAALEVVRQMPDWKPGTINGKPVKVWYTVPVNYQLEDLEAGKIRAEEARTAKIYPNPTSGRLSMEISEWIPDLLYGVYDADGRMVKQGPMTSRVETIDLSSLSNGIYIVRISSEEESFMYSERVLKK